jgi:lipoprotein-anchoring transpeptidase ErfK/SrfK
MIAMRVLLGAATAGALLLTSVGAADAAAFQSRASTLERTWQADQAAGISIDELAAARTALNDLKSRHFGPLPYAIVSGAILFDPFTSAEAKAVAGARKHAEDSLSRLREASGPNFDARGPRAQLGRTRSASDYLRLSRAWDVDARRLAGVRDQLSATSGGLSDGLPADVLDAVAHLQSVTANASQAKLGTDPSAKALQDAQAYLKKAYPEQLAGHGEVVDELRAAIAKVQHRLDTRALADQLVGQMPDLMAQAAKYSVAGFQGRVDQAKSDLQAAETAQDDARMDTAVGAARQVVNDLSSAVKVGRKKAQDAALTAKGCIPDAPAQLIVIHLATQQLTAFSDGCPFLTTLVTTGRPALPTDQGTFQIAAKFPTYKMISPWPKGSPYWYPDTVVYDAMEFVVADGTFIHSAEWQPDNTYGPGSQNGQYASHGCVHVRHPDLDTLFNWAKVGATVTVTPN